MHGRVLGWSAAFLVVVVPGATAEALEATLQAVDPFGFVGPLLVGLEHDFSGGVWGTTETYAAQNRSLVEAETVRISMLRYEQPPGSPRQLVLDVTGATGTGSAQVSHDARIAIVNMTHRGEAFVYEPIGDSFRIRADAERCDIQPARRAEPILFPSDPDAAGPRAPYAPGFRQLEADCAVDLVIADRPTWVRLYGMDVRVDSDEGSYSLRTGTFEEADPTAPGGARTVTQVLQLEYAASPFRLAAAGSARWRFFASEFLGLGELSAGPSSGALRWGDLRQSGDVDPFTTQGTFSFAAEPSGQVGIQGSTRNGPVFGSPATAPSGPGLRPAALAAGGLALVWLARFVWTLFTRLDQDRLLDHPRRARILDYVRANPGVEPTVVARELGFARSIALHHIAHLQRAGRLVLLRLGGRTAAFASPGPGPDRGRQVVLLRGASHRRIHDALRVNPGLDQRGLAAALGLSQQRISQCLRGLEAAGLVRREPSNGVLRYYEFPAAAAPPPSGPAPVGLHEPGGIEGEESVARRPGLASTAAN